MQPLVAHPAPSLFQPRRGLKAARLGIRGSGRRGPANVAPRVPADLRVGESATRTSGAPFEVPHGSPWSVKVSLHYEKEAWAGPLLLDSLEGQVIQSEAKEARFWVECGVEGDHGRAQRGALIAELPFCPPES